VSVLAYLIFVAVFGLAIGGLARLALPGPDPLTLWETMLVGIAGSLIAGLVWWALFGHGGGGLVVSVLFSTVIVYFIRRSRGGSLTDPGGPPAPRR
jgi:uncharacterized membrane protein YeaQ/YmgE (transglycosylase-associated protein family)